MLVLSFVAMLKKISLKKITLLLEKSKVATPPTKGVVIREKRPQEDVHVSSSNKKRRLVDGSKGNETMPLFEVKNAKSSKLESKETA